jgi:hypothetical protein
MKNSVGIVLLLILVVAALCMGATSNTDAEIVKALNVQNQQLSRIATSLEKISGQQPGWKLPK